VQLRVGEARPSGTPRGDILFFHGFSDRMDNHRPLFEEWTQRGFRVLSFEYPSHGETCGRNLVHYLYPSLARFALQIEEETREDSSRPLLLAGWSMGGLLAARMMQGLEGPFSRPIAGAMLLTPGVAVHAFLGTVKNETLTRNPKPPHTGPIRPTRPAIFPIAANILYHGDQAHRTSMPVGIPVLTVVGGDEEDVYAKSQGVRSWVQGRRAEGVTMLGLSCPGGYHEIDNEPAPMGPSVRRELGRFAEAVLDKTTYAAPLGADVACRGF
jgi:alpha-beta hydrolase superfamily lysophospholipase